MPFPQQEPAGTSSAPLRRMGKYRLLRQLAQGGMGAIYEAVHEEIGQRTAIKVLKAELCKSKDITLRFLNEARAVSAVRHPGLLTIFEFDRLDDGTAYIVMELLDGVPLSSAMHEKETLTSLPAEYRSQAIGWVRQIATALAVVHAKGIIHRDLKPSNIMLVPDPEVAGGTRTKILDFGIAKLSLDPDATTEHGDPRLPETRSNVVMGTPAYMAPEQCRSACAVDHRADVYSLGVIFYELLTGTLPFSAPNAMSLMMQHIHEKLPPLSSHERAKGVPPYIADLIGAMLEKNPANRPSMAEVAAILTEGASRPSKSKPRRSKAVPALLFSFGLLIFLVAIGTLYFQKGPPPVSPKAKAASAPAPSVIAPDPVSLSAADLGAPLVRPKVVEPKSGAQQRSRPDNPGPKKIQKQEDELTDEEIPIARP